MYLKFDTDGLTMISDKKVYECNWIIQPHY